MVPTGSPVKAAWKYDDTRPAVAWRQLSEASIARRRCC